MNEFIELLPAQQRVDEVSWYGTADAVYQNLDIIRQHGPARDRAGGDHIGDDYLPCCLDHANLGSRMTVAASRCRARRRAPSA